MFKRKDVIRTVFLSMVIILIMVTLSQILVVHRRNHQKKKSRAAEKSLGILTMLLNIEKSIEAMMKKEHLPAKRYEEQLLAEVYAERIKQHLEKLKRANQIHSKTQSKRSRKLGDSTYTAFHERKLRFLEMNENELMTRMKTDYISNAKGGHSTVIKKGSAYISSNNSILSVDITGHNPSVISKHDPDNQQITISTRITSAHRRYTNSSKDIGRDFKRQKNYGGYGQRPQNTYQDKSSRNAFCADIPNDLEGQTLISRKVPIDNLHERQFSDIQPGGYWKPKTCIARQRTAIIVPYRDREIHLHTLLHYIIPILKRQLIEFRIFVSEQYGTTTFNKGRVMNAGFTEAWKLWTFDCVIFHDVDLLPENDRNMYTCGQFPRHMSISVDKFSYRLPYWTLVGGVFSIKREQFLRVNGYSNLYWGWGAEDDDMSYRLETSNLKIERPPANIGRYKMIKHANRETSPVKMRAYLLKTVKKRYHRDGLNTLDYQAVFINNTKLFTHIMVEVGQPPEEAANITKLLN